MIITKINRPNCKAGKFIIKVTEGEKVLAQSTFNDEADAYGTFGLIWDVLGGLGYKGAFTFAEESPSKKEDWRRSHDD